MSDCGFYTIQKNIPMPLSINSSQFFETCENLTPGDSFVCPLGSTNSQTIVEHFLKEAQSKLNFNFAAKQVLGGMRIWRTK